MITTQELVDRFKAGIQRYRENRPEDAEWRARVNDALARFLASEIERQLRKLDRADRDS